jgi:hypothetical protein
MSKRHVSLERMLRRFMQREGPVPPAWVNSSDEANNGNLSLRTHCSFAPGGTVKMEMQNSWGKELGNTSW